MSLKELLDPKVLASSAVLKSGFWATVDRMLVAEGFVDANGQPDIVAAFCACPRCKQDSWALCRCHDDDFKMTWEAA